MNILKGLYNIFFRSPKQEAIHEYCTGKSLPYFIVCKCDFCSYIKDLKRG